MSADLFAVFGDASQASAPQRNQQPPGTTHPISTAKDDPFSFLSPTSPPSQPQGQQLSAQWSPFQQTTTGPPQANNGWGKSIGSLEALGASHQRTDPQDPGQEEEDDDGWGEFEVAQTSFPAQPPAPQSASIPPGAPATRTPAVEMLTNNLVDLGLESLAPEPRGRSPSLEKSAETRQRQKPAHNPDPNVLFDADFEAENVADDDDDDDFGEFETGAPATTTSQTAPAKSAVDLLSLDPEPATVPAKKQAPGVTLSNGALQAGLTAYPGGLKASHDSMSSRGPEPTRQLKATPTMVPKTPRVANAAPPSPATARSAIEDDGFGNNWEESKDIPETKPTASKSQQTPNPKTTSQNPAVAGTPATDWEWQDWGGTENQVTRGGTATTTTPTTVTLAQPFPSVTTSEQQPPGPPPTNIPPPAILLSLFPSLLDLAQHALLKPLLTLPPSSPAYQRVLAAEPTYDFLRGYLALAAVAARLITGRKHRWHRDKFLAQSMSVSAACGVGGQRGMKLACVDKAQTAHDDREAAEVAAAWKRGVGRLRAVVAGVNAARGAGGGAGRGVAALRVPEVAVGLAVTTAKGVPTAPRACVVCGLKRDERVAKVDWEVEDSFGEWWVEFWGHRECRNFWLEHEKKLRQR
ncbi:hypothetical protein MYCTH_2304112 [Thermothelomyces thermophilus ATCC 42464]|uniref:Uncharacterized protein n=1 Tax=Thermothelomyces thermophilus (strain ATCC 42464 / BCRC 31852 / DSM 1799) TaxID=573729 RepID=G2QE91_THET4|nr:uncharacterized protein MYCTH_2304112 [Thermothelomyces thermophilus ATCC 42464]AEO57674.1 hypothetical protein MYCTH_2304112 [Thermothelomyces thermophilus ATCC 42464]